MAGHKVNPLVYRQGDRHGRKARGTAAGCYSCSRCIAGYSRLMGNDEEGTLDTLKALRSSVFDPKVAEHHGRIVKTTGDGALVEFASAVDATRCAMEIQRAMAERNAGISEERRVEFRIGINVGDIIIDDGDIYGDGVNIAARVEALASPGAVCLSNNAYQQIKGKLALDVSDLGEQHLKNIAEPVRIYGVRLDGAPERPTLALPDKPSIAVLPFQNMSVDPEQEYFADGIAEDIITALSKLRWFFVIARNRSVGMSALGQERTSERGQSMSALPPKADFSSVLWDVQSDQMRRVIRPNWRWRAKSAGSSGQAPSRS
jgi:adenylate/guanylate cyclase family protein